MPERYIRDQDFLADPRFATASLPQKMEALDKIAAYNEGVLGKRIETPDGLRADYPAGDVFGAIHDLGRQEEDRRRAVMADHVAGRAYDVASANDQDPAATLEKIQAYVAGDKSVALGPDEMDAANEWIAANDTVQKKVGGTFADFGTRSRFSIDTPNGASIGSGLAFTFNGKAYNYLSFDSDAEGQSEQDPTKRFRAIVPAPKTWEVANKELTDQIEQTKARLADLTAQSERKPSLIEQLGAGSDPQSALSQQVAVENERKRLTSELGRLQDKKDLYARGTEGHTALMSEQAIDAIKGNETLLSHVPRGEGIVGRVWTETHMGVKEAYLGTVAGLQYATGFEDAAKDTFQVQKEFSLYREAYGMGDRAFRGSTWDNILREAGPELAQTAVDLGIGMGVSKMIRGGARSLSALAGREIAAGVGEGASVVARGVANAAQAQSRKRAEEWMIKKFGKWGEAAIGSFPGAFEEASGTLQYVIQADEMDDQSDSLRAQAAKLPDSVEFADQRAELLAKADSLSSNAERIHNNAALAFWAQVGITLGTDAIGFEKILSRKGVPLKESAARALVSSRLEKMGVTGATEKVINETAKVLLDDIESRTVDFFVKSPLANNLMQRLEAGLFEGSTELLQGVLNNAVTQQFLDENQDIFNANQGASEFGVGMLIGTIMKRVSSSVDPAVVQRAIHQTIDSNDAKIRETRAVAKAAGEKIAVGEIDGFGAVEDHADVVKENPDGTFRISDAKDVASDQDPRGIFGGLQFKSREEAEAFSKTRWQTAFEAFLREDLSKRTQSGLTDTLDQSGNPTMKKSEIEAQVGTMRIMADATAASNDIGKETFYAAMLQSQEGYSKADIGIETDAYAEAVRRLSADPTLVPESLRAELEKESRAINDPNSAPTTHPELQAIISTVAATLDAQRGSHPGKVAYSMKQNDAGEMTGPSEKLAGSPGTASGINLVSDGKALRVIPTLDSKGKVVGTRVVSMDPHALVQRYNGESNDKSSPTAKWLNARGITSPASYAQWLAFAGHHQEMLNATEGPAQDQNKRRNEIQKRADADFAASKKKGGLGLQPAGVKLTDTGGYTSKDQQKAASATKFIGRGSKGSSTDTYAKDFGRLANAGAYTPGDVVFISSNGSRDDRVAPDFAEISKAIAAGARFVTDDPAGRSRPYNVGEREVADFLRENGYHEASANGMSTWAASPVEASVTPGQNARSITLLDSSGNPSPGTATIPIIPMSFWFGGRSTYNMILTGHRRGTTRFAYKGQNILPGSIAFIQNPSDPSKGVYVLVEESYSLGERLKELDGNMRELANQIAREEGYTVEHVNSQILGRKDWARQMHLKYRPVDATYAALRQQLESAVLADHVSKTVTGNVKRAEGEKLDGTSIAALGALASDIIGASQTAGEPNPIELIKKLPGHKGIKQMISAVESAAAREGIDVLASPEYASLVANKITVGQFISGLSQRANTAALAAVEGEAGAAMLVAQMDLTEDDERRRSASGNSPGVQGPSVAERLALTSNPMEVREKIRKRNRLLKFSQMDASGKFRFPLGNVGTEQEQMTAREAIESGRAAFIGTYNANDRVSQTGPVRFKPGSAMANALNAAMKSDSKPLVFVAVDESGKHHYFSQVEYNGTPMLFNTTQMSDPMYGWGRGTDVQMMAAFYLFAVDSTPKEGGIPISSFYRRWTSAMANGIQQSTKDGIPNWRQLEAGWRIVFGQGGHAKALTAERIAELAILNSPELTHPDPFNVGIKSPVNTRERTDGPPQTIQDDGKFSGKDAEDRGGQDFSGFNEGHEIRVPITMTNRRNGALEAMAAEEERDSALWESLFGEGDTTQSQADDNASNAGKEGAMTDVEWAFGNGLDSDNVENKKDSILTALVKHVLGGEESVRATVITNINDLISKGGGTVAVTNNGRKVKFKQFGVAIDGNTAEVVFVELDPAERGNGIGLAAYESLGKALAAKGIVLQSSKAQYASGRGVWKKLTQKGLAKKGAQGVYYFNLRTGIESPEIVQARIALAEAQKLREQIVADITETQDLIDEAIDKGNDAQAREFRLALQRRAESLAGKAKYPGDITADEFIPDLLKFASRQANAAETPVTAEDIIVGIPGTPNWGFNLNHLNEIIWALRPKEGNPERFNALMAAKSISREKRDQYLKLIKDNPESPNVTTWEKWAAARDDEMKAADEEISRDYGTAVLANALGASSDEKLADGIISNLIGSIWYNQRVVPARDLYSRLAFKQVNRTTLADIVDLANTIGSMDDHALGDELLEEIDLIQLEATNGVGFMNALEKRIEVLADEAYCGSIMFARLALMLNAVSEVRSAQLGVKNSARSKISKPKNPTPGVPLTGLSIDQIVWRSLLPEGATMPQRDSRTESTKEEKDDEEREKLLGSSEDLDGSMSGIEVMSAEDAARQLAAKKERADRAEAIAMLEGGKFRIPGRTSVQDKADGGTYDAADKLTAKTAASLAGKISAQAMEISKSLPSFDEKSESGHELKVLNSVLGKASSIDPASLIGQRVDQPGPAFDAVHSLSRAVRNAVAAMQANPAKYSAEDVAALKRQENVSWEILKAISGRQEQSGMSGQSVPTPAVLSVLEANTSSGASAMDLWNGMKSIYDSLDNTRARKEMKRNFWASLIQADPAMLRAWKDTRRDLQKSWGVPVITKDPNPSESHEEALVGLYRDNWRPKSKTTASLYQDDMGDGKKRGTARGKIQLFNGALPKVSFTKDATPSTFIHEMMHWMMNVRGGAQGKRLMEVMLGENEFSKVWDYATNGGKLDPQNNSQRRNIEERVAYGVEQYFGDLGKRSSAQGNNPGELAMPNGAAARLGRVIRRIWNQIYSKDPSVDQRMREAFDSVFNPPRQGVARPNQDTPPVERVDISSKDGVMGYMVEKFGVDNAELAAEIAKAMDAETGAPARTLDAPIIPETGEGNDPEDLATAMFGVDDQGMIDEGDQLRSEVGEDMEDYIPEEAFLDDDEGKTLYQYTPTARRGTRTVSRVRATAESLQAQPGRLARFASALLRFGYRLRARGAAPLSIFRAKLRANDHHSTVEGQMLRHQNEISSALSAATSNLLNPSLEHRERGVMNTHINNAMGSNDANVRAAALQAMPDRLRIAVQNARVFVDGLMEDLVNRGIIYGQGAVGLWSSKQGFFIHRSYAFTNKNAIDQEQWARESNGGQLWNDAIARLTRYGTPPAEADRLLSNLIKFVGNTQRGGKSPVTTARLFGGVDELAPRGSAAANSNGDWLNGAVAEVLGEQTDSEVRFVNTVKAINDVVLQHEMQAQVRDEGLASGWVVKYEDGKPLPKGYIRFNEKKDVDLRNDPYLLALSKGPLAGYAAPADLVNWWNGVIHDEIQNHEIHPFLQAMAAVNGTWKYSKTVLSVTTSFNNAVSSYLTMISTGHTHAGLGRALAAAMAHEIGHTATGKLIMSDATIAKFRAVYDSLSAVGAVDSGTFAEVMDTFRRAPRLTEMFSTLAIAHGTAHGDAASEMGRRARGFLGKAKNTISGIYRYGDAIFKMAVTMAEVPSLERAFPGKTQDEYLRMAAARANDTMYSFQREPNLLRSFRAYVPVIGPFFSYSYGITRAMTMGLRTAAGDIFEGFARQRAGDAGGGAQAWMGLKRMGGLMAVGYGAQALAAFFASKLGWDDDRDKAARKLLPDYDRDGVLVYTNEFEAGKGAGYINISRFLPFMTPTKGFQHGAGLIAGIVQAAMAGDKAKVDETIDKHGTRALMQILAPFLDEQSSFVAANMLIRGVDRNGRKIVGLNDSGTESVWKVLEAYAKEFIPGTVNSMDRAGLIPASMQGITGAHPVPKDRTLREKLLYMMGFKFSELDIGRGLARNVGDAMARAAEAKDSLGRLLKKEGPVSAQEIVAVGMRAKQDADRASHDAALIIDASTKLGYPVPAQIAALKHAVTPFAGSFRELSTQQIKSSFYGVFRSPFYYSKQTLIDASRAQQSNKDSRAEGFSELHRKGIAAFGSGR